MNILLSIIIPHYNSPEGLNRLLTSIPVRDDFQIIVVDDHSNIDISSIVSLHKSAVLINQDDGVKYAGAARNKGIVHASGDYILFADSDDYFVKGAFDILESYYKNNYDVVFFSPVSINEDGSKSLRHLKYKKLVDDFLNCGKDNILYEFFVPWSKLISRSFLLSNNITFDEIIASNDVMASLKIGFYASSYHISNETIYCVVESSSSLTKQVSEQVVDSRFNVLCRYNDFICININPDRQLSVSSSLSRALKISFYKFLSVLFFSLHKKYPIFPNMDGWSRWFNRLIK